MKYVLVLCAIGFFISTIGLFEQLGRYFGADADQEAAEVLLVAVKDLTERRLKDFIPDEKSAAFVKACLLPIGRSTNKQLARLQRSARSFKRELWDAGALGSSIFCLGDRSMYVWTRHDEEAGA